MNRFYASITNRLISGATRAALGVRSFRSDSLREHLRSLWEGTPGSENAFLSDIIFESTFNWQTSKHTFGSLSGKLLHPDLVNAMSSPLKDLKDDYAFPEQRYPYKHQLKSWKQLIQKQPSRSVLVSSGTGSGKTECFLVPILNDLANESKKAGPLVGTRALFLYPLNALIKSQRDRLLAWSEPFEGKIRFCLYNGDTPKESKKTDHKSEILDRKNLRATPPPILVTNSTMLEYMLVRNEDRPIIEQSQGKLRWIVIDEAHNYIGSQAADLTLLIRRVLHAFDCDMDQVHFVATSATIANAENNPNVLRDFLADIAGVHPDRISVINGYRETPELKMPEKHQSQKKLSPPDHLKELSPDQLYDNLCTFAPLRNIRKKLMKNTMPLSDISRQLFHDTSKKSIHLSLQWLDLCTQGIHPNKESFMPLRGHIFQRAISGIWACANKKCRGIQGTPLSNGDWDYGKIFLERRLICDSCKSPVFEVVQCSVCGATCLIASEVQKGKNAILKPYTYNQDEDEFQQELEPLDIEQNDEEPSEELQANRRLLIPDNDTFGMKTRLLEDGQMDSNNGIEICLMVPDGNERLTCICCNTKEQNSYLFTPIRIGAPFLLQTAIPIILNQMPAFNNAINDLPHQGRRILSFTDSRQGTARFSTKLQLETERNFVRSVLYHSVHARIEKPDDDNTAKIKDEIHALKNLKSNSDAIQNIITEKQQALDQLQSPAPGRLSWNDAINRLLTTTSFKEFLLPPLKEQTFGFNDCQLAELCLWREFMSRPRRQFSLEVFGLLRIGYPVLERIRTVPSVARQHRISLDDWQALAHILMDFKIRTEMSVAITRDVQRWVGYPGQPGFIIGPDQTKSKKKQKTWPSTKTKVHRKSRLVRMIAYGLQLDLENHADCAEIEALLIELWHASSPILTLSEDGYHLELNRQIDFVQVREAWICPVTRRLLPMTFKGITPYLPLNATSSLSECIKVSMPSLPSPYWLEKDRMSSEQWLETDPDIIRLRQSGVWTDLCDNIAAFSKYFYSTEHSAQISGPTLSYREKQFKEGRINVLSCSTTMEMGVDIGGLTTITMNNVPPHPANFLQRAGRAGRRGETKALSFTLCKSNPHGESVFQNPMWPFTSQLSIPQVSLQSQPIVQRHINSLILSFFLHHQAPDDIWHLTCGWFFGAGDEDHSPPCEQFRFFCENDAITHQRLKEGIFHLTKRTILAGVPIAHHLQTTIEMIKEVIQRWNIDYQSLNDNLSLVKTPGGKSKAEAAINIQMKRMRKEYLLKDLANHNFLPGYGFATGLACLVTTTIEQINIKGKILKGKKLREDNKAMRAGYPSRPLPVAIRDYAPGTDTVLDGRVYHSSGITLNWQIPADLEGPPEIQSLRWVWRCKTCGANGTRYSIPTTCPQCGEQNSDQLKQYEYIQPSGFAVDIRWKPHNDISIPQYLPVRDPLISLEGADWLSLPTTVLGRYRFSTNGALFYRTDGLHGEGFVLCFRCGRADAMLPEGKLPLSFADKDGNPIPHKRLRGGKDHEMERECPGSHEDFAIKTHLRLGATVYTDVLELQLNQLNGIPLDRVQAYSTGVALRLALARKLGIDDQEIGSIVSPGIDDHGHPTYSIFLFDTAQGGAGYVKHALQELPSLFRHAQKIVTCPKKCDTACHSCLLDFNTQYHLEELNSVRTLALLNHTYLDAFELPKNLKLLGETAKLELEPMPLAIYRELQRVNLTQIRIHLSGEISQWELLDWWMFQELLAIGKTGCQIILIVPEKTRQQLEISQKDELFVVLESTHAKLYAVDQSRLSKGKSQDIAPLIEMGHDNGSVIWYATTPNGLTPGRNWGSGLNHTQYVRVKNNEVLAPVPEGGFFIQSSELKQSENHISEVIIANELNGSVNQFGQKAWQLILSKTPAIKRQLNSKQPLKKIIYNDRYLFSPLVFILLKKMLKELQSFQGGMRNQTRIEIHTQRLNTRNKTPFLINHDWCFADDRKTVFESILQLDNQPLIVEKAKKDIPHARSLDLIWSETIQFTICLDQGMGYWTTSSRVPFQFDQSPQDQIKRLETMDFNVTDAGGIFSTQWYIK
ncbi:MAG: DEAD/DEAH box helicase [Candidatus Magnetomorum sp.]|nr:DEAD/DEAH box helicase [Candidatus Magnetomorum sp.]